jgi:hypothetical protein
MAKEQFTAWFSRIILLSLLPLLLLSFYAHPAADDFPISETARDWGSYTTVVGYYKCWSARYTSLFLMSLNPLAFGWFKGYKLGAPLLMAGLFFSLLYFFNQFTASRLRSFTLTVVFVTVFLLNMPDLAGGLYYLGGSLFYQPGNMLLVLLLGSLMKFPPPSGFYGLSPARWFAVAVQGLLLILLAGCNEISMMLSLAIPAAGFLLHWFQEKRPVFTWFLFLFLSVVCTVVILKSPATFYRMEASGSFERSIAEVGLLAFHGMMQAFMNWFSSPSFFLSIAVLFFFSGKGVSEMKLPYALRIFALLSSLLLFYACFLPSFLGEGVLQGHTENSLLFLFFILLFLNLQLWKKPILAGKESLQFLKPVLLAGLMLALPFSGGFRLAVSDLWSGEAAAYSAERDHRDSLMRNTPGDTVWVEAVKHKPKSLFAGDIGDYPDPWYDNHFAAMYRKKWVGLKKK